MSSSCASVSKRVGKAENWDSKGWADFKKRVDDYWRKMQHHLTRQPMSRLTVRQVVKDGQ